MSDSYACEALLSRSDMGMPSPDILKAQCHKNLTRKLMCEDVQELDEDTIYDFMTREDGSGWQQWRARVPPWTYPKHQKVLQFSQLVVPTVDSVRYQYLLSLVQATGKVEHYQIICLMY